MSEVGGTLGICGQILVTTITMAVIRLASWKSSVARRNQSLLMPVVEVQGKET
jgi:hypothetical protein